MKCRKVSSDLTRNARLINLKPQILRYWQDNTLTRVKPWTHKNWIFYVWIMKRISCPSLTHSEPAWWIKRCYFRSMNNNCGLISWTKNISFHYQHFLMHNDVVCKQNIKNLFYVNPWYLFIFLKYLLNSVNWCQDFFDNFLYRWHCSSIF